MKKTILLIISLLLITGCSLDFGKPEEPPILPTPTNIPEKVVNNYVSYNGPLKVRGKRYIKSIQ